MKIVDIAALTGTSVATVSRVINNDPHVSESTRKKVQEVLDNTNFLPNAAGKSLRQRNSKQLLAVLPTITNPVYAPIVEGLSAQANAHGYSVVLAVTGRSPAKEREYLDMLKMKTVDGIILCATTLDDEIVEDIAAKYPLVSCFKPIKSGKVSYVCIEDDAASYEATKYLISLGHKHIAVIRNTFNPISQKLRDRGYHRAMKEAGLECFCDEMCYCEDSAQVYEVVSSLMCKKNPPTAIFSFSDMLALPAIKYLSDKGFRVGRDIDIIGFDNINIAEHSVPALTTVSQPLYQLGVSSFELLYEKISNMDSLPKGIIFPHHLVIRESTRK